MKYYTSVSCSDKSDEILTTSVGYAWVSSPQDLNILQSTLSGQSRGMSTDRLIRAVTSHTIIYQTLGVVVSIVYYSPAFLE